jgi:hypothetical protein
MKSALAILVPRNRPGGSGRVRAGRLWVFVYRVAGGGERGMTFSLQQSSRKIFQILLTDAAVY